MTRDVVISLCDKSGVMVRPWAEAGYTCFCVDIQHSIRRDRIEGNIRFVWGDARSWTPPEDTRGRIAAVFAFPPCTHVTCSDARDFRKKSGWMLADALQVFDACYMAGVYSGAPFMVENPVGRLNTHRRAPDYSFHPWNYGDLWTKKTCLWTGNDFVMPPFIHHTEPAGVTPKIWEMPPSDDRADARSETPPGFARAVFEANKQTLSAPVDSPAACERRVSLVQ